jgi:glutaminyl-tRNA synthetase
MTTPNRENARAASQPSPGPDATLTTPAQDPAPAPKEPSDFIRDIVASDLESGVHQKIVTRFPPEPNGYLHIGHAKAICLNFGIAREFKGICNFRMDDTNPAKEEIEYVDAITRDVRWLISGWADHCLGLRARGSHPIPRTIGEQTDFHLPSIPADPANPAGTESNAEPFFASAYFEQLFEYAERLIRSGNAFVCDLSLAEMEEYRGIPERPGKESPCRGRSPEENLDLFRRMNQGEFPDGSRTLRAKINMASPNIWLRDPVLYRIRAVDHHQTGNRWRVYPMYDFAHCLSDYIEGITHSICTLEFEVHRPLYNWILEHLNLPRPLPHQYEFALLNIEYTVMSKRKLLELVREQIVTGWDDPRMPTLSGLRRRGVRPEAIRNFAHTLGVTKYNGLTDLSLLEHAIRDDLNQFALRRLAVLRPVRVIIDNWEEGQFEQLEAVNNPANPESGTRSVPFGRELFIEQEDFMEVPPPKYFRLRPGGEVRLKYAYIIKCERVVKDTDGRVTEIHCTADLGSKTGGPTASRKVKGTIHWVSAAHCIDARVHLYDRLFRVPEPDADGDFRVHLNPESLSSVVAKCEPSLKDAKPELRYQFERMGYFCLDTTSTAEKPVFNRTISLRDTWSKPAPK